MLSDKETLTIFIFLSAAHPWSPAQAVPGLAVPFPAKTEPNVHSFAKKTTARAPSAAP